MKKFIYLIIILVLGLSCLGIAACDSGDDDDGATAEATMVDTSEATENPTEEPTEESTDTLTSSGFTWDDIPIYPGANEAEEFSMSVGGAEYGDFERIEWRYYDVDAAVDDVASFYEDEMPDYDWDEVMTMNLGEMAWNYWEKSGGDTGAYIGVAENDGDTILWMWRGQGLDSEDNGDETPEDGGETPDVEFTAGDFTWDDIPLYPGADEAEEFSMAMAGGDEGDCGRLEWRYYEVDGDVEDVASFYEDEMPDNGWEEVMNMDLGEMAWSYWQKEGEKIQAYVGVAEDGGDVMLWMWRGQECA